MDIGKAVQAMHEGARVARPGWNGKGMWVALRKPQARTTIARQDHEQVMTTPFVYMKTSDGHFIPWLCSQADLLADDWEIVRE